MAIDEPIFVAEVPLRLQSSPGFRSTGAALVRAAVHGGLVLPSWPDLTEPRAEHVESWVDWLRQVWACEEIAAAIAHASPVLERQVRALCVAENPAVRDAYRAVVSTARYVQRLVGRATPFGLFAGVAPAAFAAETRVEWGSAHHAIARPGAQWLADVIAQLERCPELIARLLVVANSTMFVRGDRLVVPHQPHARPDGVTTPVEITLRRTAPVRLVVDAARDPIRLDDVAAKVAAEFPAASESMTAAMLAELLARRVLITDLHAPSTEPDPLRHLTARLEAVNAAAIAEVSDVVTALREVQALLDAHNDTPEANGQWVRDEAATRMRRVAPTVSNPLAVDLRLDATVNLPTSVAREVERVASVLTQLSADPFGRPAWSDYHQRFYERFGIGSMVPLLDVVDPDSGIGWPHGYPGAQAEERRPAPSPRDETLLGLAQAAALDGRDEIVLDSTLLAKLDRGPKRPRLPAHVELSVQVHAADVHALDRGDFTMELVSVSRAAGALMGRFLNVLAPQDRIQLAGGLANLPCGDPDTVPAQLSFPPLDPATAHVARAVQVLPTVISLGEHRQPGGSVLTVSDLAVACDGRRMYLAAPHHGFRVEATGMHALNLRRHTPSLARFLTELGRGQCAQVTAFDWGAAASLPFLPRVRYGRTILAPARWRLNAVELPGRSADWSVWDAAFGGWGTRRRLPRRVHLVEGDRRLPLDLDETTHRVLLRAHLGKKPQAVLVEAPPVGSAGWFGNRPHEIIVPLVATEPPAWPRLPKPTAARLITRSQGQTPATSGLLMAKLYGDVARQNDILGYLPGLLGHWDTEPAWWFLRFRDPEPHIRLRITLPDPAAFGPAAHTVSTWADDLHQRGLLRDVQYVTSYPETGRWGSGPAMTAAEGVFSADSRAVLAQLSQRVRPHRQALVAAHSSAIAVAFTGSVKAGMRWVIDHVPAAAPQSVARSVFDEAVRLADPSDQWAALRAAPGGAAITGGWQARTTALAEYRTHLPGPQTEGIDPDDVLGSLMHAHFVRAVGIDFDDEALSLYLARAAALSWSARHTAGRP